MLGNRTRHFVRTTVWLRIICLLAAVSVAAGCESFGSSGRGGGFRTAPIDDDVVEIINYYPLLPWTYDADGRVAGVKVRTYFKSGKREKGIYVTGPISVTLSEVWRGRDGQFHRERIHEWSFSRAQADGFRIVKPAIGGDSYGFFLHWPTDLDVMGRTIELVFHYQRSDGKFIIGRPWQRKVPLPPGFPAPRERITRTPRNALSDEASFTSRDSR
jgi:hypothetical protein